MIKHKTHIVKKMETLMTIARLYNVDFNKLAKLNKLNQLNNYKIKIGQTIKLPIIEKENPTEK